MTPRALHQRENALLHELWLRLPEDATVAALRRLWTKRDGAMKARQAGSGAL